jgi:hypothetical protein
MRIVPAVLLKNFNTFSQLGLRRVRGVGIRIVPAVQLKNFNTFSQLGLRRVRVVGMLAGSTKQPTHIHIVIHPVDHIKVIAGLERFFAFHFFTA